MEINLMTQEQFAEYLIEEIMSGTSASNVMHLLDQYSNRDDFKQLARPIMKYLCNHHHPHTTIIISGTNAEILEGIESVGTDEFLVD